MTETLFCLLVAGLSMVAGFALAVLWNVRVRPTRPMVGFFASLTPEQQKLALENREDIWQPIGPPERTDLDMTGARFVEVQWDETARRVWINTERGLVGRIYGVSGEFIIKRINQVGKQK